MPPSHLREALVALGWIFVAPCAAVAVCIAVAITFGVVFFVPTLLAVMAGLAKVLLRPA